MPKIIDKSFEDLLEDERRRALLYVPEWRSTSEGDFGVALLKIFTHMQEEIIGRLNKVPEKNFGAFLDMLGIRLSPARPARAPVTFHLAEGLRENVFVPAATQVATAETKEHGALTYETTKNFTATRASVEEIFSTDPKKDAIYSHLGDLREKGEFKFFDGENLQEHILYMGHLDLFKVDGSAEITLLFSFKNFVSLGDLKSWRWIYWTEDGEKEFVVEDGAIRENEIKPEAVDHKGGCEYLVTLRPEAEIKEMEVTGRKSRWIGCKIGSASIPALPVIKKIIISDISRREGETLTPDLGFYNFIPLDLSKDFLPFGRQPRLFDSFYIASDEAFSKKGAEITISFAGTGDHDSRPDLSWEYWDRSSWISLKVKDPAEDNSCIFNPETFNGCVKFDCPGDLMETEVGGEMNRWIRVRIVGGDYGREEFIHKVATIPKDASEEKPTKEDASKEETSRTRPSLGEALKEDILKKKSSEVEVIKEETWVVSPNFHPPSIERIEIFYQFSESQSGEYPQFCLTYNNLEYRDVSEKNRMGKGFEPFVPLLDEDPTIYLGFGSPFGKGNVNIFFSVKEDASLSDDPDPEVGWHCWCKAPGILEYAVGEGGRSELVLASSASEGMRIGTKLLLEEIFDGSLARETATVIAVDGEHVCLDKILGSEYARSGRLLRRERLDIVDDTENLTKSETVEFIGPSDQMKITKFGRDRYWLVGISTGGLPFPMKGIYPNTVWAEQVETIKDEIIGSGNGEKSGRFSFVRRPVISPEIWVREGTAIPADDRGLLASEGIEVEEVKNEAGKVVDAWVRWREVEDLFDSGPKSRHYVLDGATGEVAFGDGINGMIPPIGTNNIKASYKSGGGVGGNVASGEVVVLKTPIAGAKRVSNPLPAEGGSDTETLEAVFRRGPHLIKHMDRAVTLEDFERLAKNASSEVARTRCYVDGSRLKIVVIPKGAEDRPTPTPGLLRTVKRYLVERCLNTIPEKRVEVSGPDYKEVRVAVSVVPTSREGVVPLEQAVTKRLKDYLHPLRGGPDGEGWRFGRDVHLSDVYSLLEGIEGVDHVESLKLNDEDEDVMISESEMVCSGDHAITMRLGVAS